MKIGMYDSGIGGLTVAGEVIKKIPNADILYIADNYNVPYGDKPAEVIKSFSCEISRYLTEHGADTVCIACNMSTAVSLEKIKSLYPDKKIYGTIEFGAGEALKYSQNIGVIATSGTVKSRAYTEYIHRLCLTATVTEEPCPEFVPLVEEDRCNTEDATEAVKYHIENILKKENIGALILGCTHYPYLTDQIKKYLPENVRIINPATAMAEFLAQENIYGNSEFSFECCATKNAENVSAVCRKMMNLDTDCRLIQWKEGKLI